MVSAYVKGSDCVAFEVWRNHDKTWNRHFPVRVLPVTKQRSDLRRWNIANTKSSEPLARFTARCQYEV